MVVLHVFCGEDNREQYIHTFLTTSRTTTFQNRLHEEGVVSLITNTFSTVDLCVRLISATLWLCSSRAGTFTLSV